MVCAPVRSDNPRALAIEHGMCACMERLSPSFGERAWFVRLYGEIILEL